jgi:superfamily II DNA/RNA helicase
MPYQSFRPAGRSNARHFAPKKYGGNRSGGNRGNKQYIDPAKFVQAAAVKVEAEAFKPTHSFADFQFNASLQHNLSAKGYVTPTPIQDQAIPAALKGQDIIGIASTGTGKTAAFALPILNKLISSRDHRALIVAPTRELAEQIEQECKAFGKGTGLLGVLLIGGTNMSNQLRTLKQHPQIVIGTPGRIKDHMQRGSLQLHRFNIVVLDEVDRMLDMGFIKDVTDILAGTNPERQAMFFSATMEHKVRGLIDGFAKEPHIVSLKASSTSENVHQDVVRYGASSEKLQKLHDILLSENVSKVIVFDETQRNVERLEKELSVRGFSSGAIHGGKSQGQRKRALASFKNNDISILVATDVAARGIDVSDISHVINYSTPNNYEDYIHRIGRAGRAGRVGYALTFIPHQ